MPYYQAVSRPSTKNLIRSTGSGSILRKVEELKLRNLPMADYSAQVLVRDKIFRMSGMQDEL